MIPLVDERIERYAAEHTSHPSELLERILRETEASRAVLRKKSIQR